MLIEIPIELGYHSDQLFLVAPAKHPTKGMGYVLCPVTRELLSSECPAIMSMVDDTIRYHTAEHEPKHCALDEGIGCVCACLDCKDHQRPTIDQAAQWFERWQPNDQ